MWLYRTLQLARPLRHLWPIGGAGPVPLPREGGALLASTHASFLDPFFIGAVAPRPIRFLMTESWYRRSRLSRILFDGCGVIATATLTPAATIAAVVRSLAAGDLVCVFPEGLISDDGRIRRFRHGIGWMAAVSGVPVYPCALDGNHRSLPRDRRWPRFVPVEVRWGRPLRFPGGPRPRPDPREVHRFVERLADEICRLAGRPEDLASARPKREVADLGPAIEDALREVPGRSATARELPASRTERE